MFQLFYILFSLISAEAQIGYCVKDEAGNYKVLPNATDYIVKGVLSEDVHQNGWYKIHIIGVDGKDDDDLMYCAGFVEGYLNQNGIYNHFSLIKEIKGYDSTLLQDYAPHEIFNFMDMNIKYVKESVIAYKDDPYWIEIGLVLTQFLGLVAGYDLRIDETLNKSARMNETEHWFFQSAGDMFDLANIYPDAKPAKEFREHCSGLVKLTQNYDDIFFSHDAWSDYRELHGELKEMYLPVSRFNAKRVVLSTRAGKISSYDDFYMADSGIYVIETTLNNYNDDLYKVVVPQSLFTWVRAYITTWVAKNGSHWSSNFVRHNSGTYNNQYVIVDSNKFVRYEKPTTDLLWIVEQFPGLYRMTDVTSQLVNDLYFPSVNTPWHKDLYELAGYPEYIKSLGDYGNYRSAEKGPRFLIMQRDAPRIKTFEDFKSFMRYNNYKRDPLSNGDPAQQILSRYDLRPLDTKNHTCPYGKKNNFGGLDAKCMRLTEAKTKLQMHAIASPSYESGLPLWNFSEYKELYDSSLNYTGLPEVWNFTWQIFGSTNFNVCEKPASDTSDDSKKKCFARNTLCGWCIHSQTCMPGEKDAPFFAAKCEDGWEVEQKIQSWAKPLIISASLITVLFVVSIYGMHCYNRHQNGLPLI